MQKSVSERSRTTIKGLAMSPPNSFNLPERTRRPCRLPVAVPTCQSPQSPNGYHFWVLQPPDGTPYSSGSCRYCGEARKFANNVDDCRLLDIDLREEA